MTSGSHHRGFPTGETRREIGNEDGVPEQEFGHLTAFVVDRNLQAVYEYYAIQEELLHVVLVTQPVQKPVLHVLRRTTSTAAGFTFDALSELVDIKVCEKV